MPAPKLIPGYDPIPDGTCLEVGFKDDEGATVYYSATVKKSHPQQSGKVLTEFQWDDSSCADDPKWRGRLFDLASQHHPWRVPRVLLPSLLLRPI